MGRPKRNERRDQQFNIGLTKAEHELLHHRAALAGMRPVDYGRARLFSKRVSADAPVPSAHHLDPLFLVNLCRIGSNLNQIARRLNTRPEGAPPVLATVLQELQALLRQGTKSDR